MMIVKCFQEGADAVLVAGCHPGDCHYNEGNYYGRRRFALLRELLAFTGVETERFRVEWVSASEGARFSKIISEFTEEIAKMGPRKAG
jgi:coenzyme F420-reducing hydrogenase delta subunit